MAKVDAYEFPVQLNEVTRAYFAAMGKITPGDKGAAYVRHRGQSAGRRGPGRRHPRPGWNGMLRTTCVPTMIKGGHATNALPQRAEANINCRIFPGGCHRRMSKARSSTRSAIRRSP